MTTVKPTTRVIAFILTLITLATLFTPSVFAEESLAEGKSTTVTIQMNEKFDYLTTTDGNRLSGYSWTYTTDTGLQGPAYCVNWGLKNPPSDKKLTIAGKYTANPATIGAFAGGYPQRSLEDFISINQGKHPELAGLTREEYACATQLAVWASLGQLGVEGTAFTSGRAMLAIQYNDPQKVRTFRALEVILDNASYWDRPLKDGLSIRQGWTEAGSVVDIEHREGIAGAEKDGAYGIKKETINGTEYYTRSFIASSATSTYKHGYCIELWAENAPEGTIFTDANNNILKTVEWDGQTLYQVPTSDELETNMNENGSEYAGEFKIAMPVRATPPDGDVIIHGTTTVTQYNIFLANNTDATEQSYVIADPLYGSAYCIGELKWKSIVTPYARLVVNKTNEVGAPLEGASFTLTGSDGSTLIGTSDHNGQIVWTELSPDVEYTLTETSAPAGYLLADPVGNIRIPAGQSETINIRDKTERTFTLKKLDAQNKSPLIGAVFAFEQVDGEHTTTYTTGHNGTLEFKGAELPYGTYRVYETVAPEGYQKDEHIETITWDGTADINLVFENVHTPSFTIIKMDEQTNEPLQDAVFDIYKDGQKITTVTTDQAGYTTVSGLTEGYYEVQETIAPDGYVLDTAKHGIQIDPYDPATEEDPVLVLTNKAKPGLKIIKYDEKTGELLEGTTFSVYKDGQLIGDFTTDRDGEIILTDLDPGTYLVQEKETDPSHIVQCSPRQIELTAGQTEMPTLVFSNHMKPGIHLLKLDAETLEPLANAVFRFEKVGGSFVKELTTGHDGEIDLKDLEPGSYLVTELTAPEGYAVDTEAKLVEIKPDEDANFVFTNTKSPDLRIVKIDAQTNERLENATFRIAPMDDCTNFVDKTTDQNGEILLEDMPEGIYSIQEINAPAGYDLNATEYHLQLEAGKTSELVVANKKRPSLRIVKYDAQTLKPLPDTVFEVYKDTVLIGTYTTDENGEILLSDLDPGTYRVQEKAVDDEHIVNSNPQEIEIVAGAATTATLVFLNHQKPGIHIVKLDSVTMKPLQDAKFLIRQVDGSYVKEYTTDVNGEIDLTKLDPGVYTVQEISAPNGYQLDDGIRTIEIKPDENATFVFTNTEKPNMKIIKVDADSGAKLQGATFRIAKIEDGTRYLDRMTDENGEILIEDLEPGVYEVLEVTAPTGYLLNETPQYITLTPNKLATVQFENYPKPSLTINKVDAITKDTIKGAKFQVVYASNNTFTGEINDLGTFLTDENGQITLENKQDGWYRITELEPAKGYAIKEPATQEIYMKAGENKEVTFENTPLSALVIKKVDTDTGEALYGAKFRVRYFKGVSGTGGTVIGEYTTSHNGTIVITGLEAGTYVVEEIQAPEHYVIVDGAETVYLTGEDQDVVTVEFANKMDSGLIIRKLAEGTNQPLAGAKFKVTNSAGAVVGTSNGEYVTDANGYIHIPGLETDTYVVEEVQAPAGYVVDNTPQTIKLKHGDTHMLTFYNKPDSGLIIKKLDAKDNQPLAGAKFKVTTDNGDVVGLSNGEYTTDENGFIHIYDLPTDTYIVQEIQAPDGYALDNTPQTVELVHGKTHTLTFYNYPDSGLIITKLDSKTGEPVRGAVFKITNDEGTVVGNRNGRYTTDRSGVIHLYDLPTDIYIVQEVQAPDGYVMDPTPQAIALKSGRTHELTFYNDPMGSLKITKLDDETRQPIKGVEFDVEKMNGERIGTYRTDSRGVIYLDELEDGWYTVTERRAAKGYKLDEEPHNVEIKNGRTANLTVTNRKTSSILIHKVDAVTGEGIYGVTFLISDANRNPIKQETSDQNGYVYLTGELADGKYFIQEIGVPEGYIIDPEVKTFWVEYGATSEITWKNTPTRAQIQITKKSKDANPINGFPAGSLLSGATFEIRDQANNLVDTIVTDQNGLAISKQLPLGRYTVKETVAPAHYLLNSTVLEANLEFAGQIVRLEMHDKSVYTNVSIAKRGYTQVVPNQSIKYDFSKIANNSTVPLDSFYWRDTLPTDAVRLDKIITGTYNTRLSYKILYKTNISGDYRTLSDNLSTATNYALDASAAALGLASNEYVTEFMFVFGSVPAGFSQVEAPAVYCNTLPWLDHEYRFTNKADAGGLYGQQWIMANDRFVTIVYNRQNPPTLPQTGY